MKFDLSRLKAERVAKGFTQAEMAKAIGISLNAYWRKEHGQRDISVEEFIRILNALGYSKKQLPLFFDRDVDNRERKEQN